MILDSIIKELTTFLTRLSNDFSENLEVSLLEINGDKVTITFKEDHNLINGDKINVSDVLVNTRIEKIELLNNNIIKFYTLSDHDLTLNFQEKVLLLDGSGELSGLFQLVSVDSRRQFTILFDKEIQTPLSDILLGNIKFYTLNNKGLLVEKSITDITLIENRELNPINNTHEVEVLAPNSISFIAKDIGIIGISDVNYSSINVSCRHRIAGGAEINRMIDIYTGTTIKENWLYVIVNEVLSGKNRTSPRDSISDQGRNQAWNIEQILNFSIYAFIPLRNDINGKNARDLIDGLRLKLYQSIVGRFVNTSLLNQAYSGIIPTSDSIGYIDNAFYVHNFQFQIVTQITKDDTNQFKTSRAFRNINISTFNDFNTKIMTNNINLDTAGR